MWWTLAAALVASLTALVIAFVAYPWQKRQDRELQLQAEKRRAYADFFFELSECRHHILVLSPSREEAREKHRLLWQKLLVLAFYAPAEVLENLTPPASFLRRYNELRCFSPDEIRQYRDLESAAWLSARLDIQSTLRDEDARGEARRAVKAVDSEFSDAVE